MRLASRIAVAAALTAAVSPAFAQSDRAARAQAELAKEIKGRTAGAPVKCLNLREIRSTRIIDRTAIVYEMAGGLIYVNTPKGGASSLDKWDVLVTNTHSSQLCDVDIVKLYDSGSRMSSGFVNLGAFVPYRKAKG
ncbi:MAG: hypothetical protein Q7J32_06810 [Sphingomonadaceae bacterium]|nr:hypothetical protein [Sphingomonadaceae bacterium]